MCCFESKVNICTTKECFGPIVSHRILALTTDKAMKVFEWLTWLLRSRTWWQCMISFFLFYFIKWYISLNVPERKGLGLRCAWGNSGSAIGEIADGRKCKSNNIEFPDRWATSRFNYFFLILFSLTSSLSLACRHIFFRSLHQEI